MNLLALIRALISGLLVLILVGCKTATNTEGSNQTDDSNIAPRLMQPLAFADFTVSDIHSPQCASNLMSQKIMIGGDNYCILGTNFDGDRICVETVNEYRAGIKAGYGPYLHYELAMATWFDQAAATLSFMIRAQPSKRSYLGKQFLDQLPVSVLHWFEDEGNGEHGLTNDAAKGLTLKDYTAFNARRHIQHLKIAGNKMTFSGKDDGCDYTVSEFARGDFDGDGYEDALVEIFISYQGGNGFYTRMFIASKTDPKQRQLKVSEFDGIK